MVETITIVILSMAAFWLFQLVILSSSFFGVYISEISLWFSWIPIANIVVAIPFIVRFARETQPNIDFILLIISLLAFLATFLRIIIPFLQVRKTNSEFSKAMKSALGSDYLENIDSSINSRFSKEVKFRLIRYIRGPQLWKLKKRVNIQDSITFRTFKDGDLQLNVYYPKREGTFPVVVFVHGGGWISGSKDEKSNIAVCLMLANLGYCVYNIDYRLTRLEPLVRKGEHPHDHPTIRDMVSDVRSAIIFAKRNASKYKGNPDEFFLFGRSAGAHLVLLTAFSCEEEFFKIEGIQCSKKDVEITGIIAFYPITNVNEFYKLHASSPVRLAIERSVGGSLEEKEELYNLFSPVSYITEERAKNIPPIFIAAGKQDKIVNVKQSKELFEKLKEHNLTSVLLVLPWANHIFDFIMYGPGGQLTFEYLTQFLVWTLSMKKMKEKVNNNE
ncbi:MAG: alpha/beta hydrolase [Candidatus Heimdallarchaeota archaeon]|nr:alpha/beta hydrolase [Candidatus Heimdallarchaeota archaeon]MBY8993894.1 alpha/beta hydrolase [Candidatus Heimdallarchaeota archaeon]